jgi:hypothetical protein
MMASPAGFFAIGLPSLNAVPMNSPAPAMPTPVTMARTAGTDAKSA